MRPSCHALIAVLAVSAFSGCRDREITAYRAPKDPVAAEMPAAAAPAAPATLPENHPPIPSGDGGAPASGGMRMSDVAVPTATNNTLTWTAPSSWVPKSGSSMRKGSYAIRRDGAEGDLGITAFPGDTGGLHANLNRWRGQVGLAPASPAELDASIERIVAASGLEFIVVDYVSPAGNPPTRLLGAIASHGGNSWFFKLTGPDALVSAEKPAYLEFLKTVKAL